MRRCLGIGLCGVLVLTNVLLGAWLLRDALLSPLLLGEVRAALRAATGATAVEGGTVHGNWVDHIALRGIQLRGADADLIQGVDDLEVEVRLDFSALWAWLSGATDALPGVAHRARIFASEVRLRTDGALPPSDPAAEPTDASGGDLPPGLHRLLTGGLELAVTRLRLDGPSDPWEGAAGLRIEPVAPGQDRGDERYLEMTLRGKGAERRSLMVRMHGHGLDQPEQAWLGFQIHGNDLMGLVEIAGVEAPQLTVPDPDTGEAAQHPLAGGALWIQGSGWRETEKRHAWVWGTLEELRAGPLSLEASYGALRWVRDGVSLGEGGSLRIERLVSRLPGVELEVESSLLPVDALALDNPALLVSRARAFGRLSIRDLEPYRRLLPLPVQQLLPITGQCRLALVDGGVVLEPSAFRFRGGQLVLPKGRLPAIAEGPAATGEIDLRLEVPEPLELTLEPAAAGSPNTPRTITLAGRVEGQITGSLERPRARLSAGLRELVFDGERIQRIGAQAEFQNSVLTLRDLTVSGWTTDADASPLDLKGTAQVTFLNQAVPDPTVPNQEPAGNAGAGYGVSLDLTAQLAPRWLARFDLSPERWPTDAGRASQVAVKITGQLGAQLSDCTGRIQLQVQDLQIADLEPLQANLTADLEPGGNVRVEDLTITGPVALNTSGALALDSSAPLSLQVTADAVDLARWTGFGLGRSIPGTAAVRAQLSGTMGAPRAALDVDLNIPGGLPDLGLQLPPDAGPGPEGPLSLRLVAKAEPVGIDVETLTVAAGTGDAQVTLQGKGQLPLRYGDGKLLHRDVETPFALTAAWALPGPDRGDGRPAPVRGRLDASTGSTGITVENIALEVGQGSCRGSGALEGRLADLLNQQPLDRGVSGEDAAAGDASPKVTGKLALQEFDLGGLPAEGLGLAELAGVLDGQLLLGGTAAVPVPALSLRMRGLTVAVPGGIRISEAEGSAQLDDGGLALQVGPALLGGGTVQLDATVTRGPSNQPLWMLPEDAVIDLHIRGEEALLANSRSVRVRGNVDVRVAGNPEGLDATGTVDLTSARYAQRISLLPDLRSAGGLATESGVVPFRVPGPLGEALRFDVAIQTERDLEVRTGVFNADLNLDMRLSGTGALPFLLGTVTSTSGRITAPGMGLRVDSLLVNFPPEDPLHPTVALGASGRRLGIDVNLTATGRADRLEAQVTSVPPYSPKALYTLVSTGQLPEGLRNQSDRDRGLLVASFLAQELAAWYLGGESTDEADSFIDRFNVEIGTEVSRLGQENIVLEYRLVERWFLQAEQDVYEDFNGGLVYRFRF